MVANPKTVPHCAYHLVCLLIAVSSLPHCKLCRVLQKWRRVTYKVLGSYRTLQLLSLFLGSLPLGEVSHHVMRTPKQPCRKLDVVRNWYLQFTANTNLFITWVHPGSWSSCLSHIWRWLPSHGRPQAGTVRASCSHVLDPQKLWNNCLWLFQVTYVLSSFVMQQ